MVTFLGGGTFTVTASYPACRKTPADGIPNVLHYSFWLCGVETRTRLKELNPLRFQKALNL
jgi:hypothetical protein